MGMGEESFERERSGALGLLGGKRSDHSGLLRHRSGLRKRGLHAAPPVRQHVPVGTAGRHRPAIYVDYQQGRGRGGRRLADLGYHDAADRARISRHSSGLRIRREPARTFAAFRGRSGPIESETATWRIRQSERYFDRSAFVVPPDNIGRFGNAGVGILRGPGTKVFSMSLAKMFTTYRESEPPVRSDDDQSLQPHEPRYSVNPEYRIGHVRPDSSNAESRPGRSENDSDVVEAVVLTMRITLL